MRDSVDTVRDVVVAATEEDDWNIDTVRNVIVNVVDENNWNIDMDRNTTTPKLYEIVYIHFAL